MLSAKRCECKWVCKYFIFVYNRFQWFRSDLCVRVRSRSRWNFEWMLIFEIGCLLLYSAIAARYHFMHNRIFTYISEFNCHWQFTTSFYHYVTSHDCICKRDVVDLHENGIGNTQPQSGGNGKKTRTQDRNRIRFPWAFCLIYLSCIAVCAHAFCSFA